MSAEAWWSDHGMRQVFLTALGPLYTVYLGDVLSS